MKYLPLLWSNELYKFQNVSRRLKINWRRRRPGLDAYQRRRRSTRCWSSGRVPICTWLCAWARSGTRSGTDYASTQPWSTARPSIGSWNGRGKPSSKLATSSSWISIWRSLSPAKLNRLVAPWGATPSPPPPPPSDRSIPFDSDFSGIEHETLELLEKAGWRGRTASTSSLFRGIRLFSSRRLALPPSGELPSGMQSSNSVSGDQALNIFEFATITYRASTLTSSIDWIWDFSLSFLNLFICFSILF